MTIQTPDSPVVPATADEEALFREARALRRRRWVRRGLIAVVLAGMPALAWVGVSRDSVARSAAGAGPAGVLPNGPVAALRLAGPLAVAGDGALYVADVARDRVLVRLPDGRFRVVAGDGMAGFSGDGGPATRAELSGISDLAFAKSGSLYIADGGRVRIVGRDGLIRTIAGDGQTPPMVTVKRDANVPRLIAAGTPALSAPLGSTQSLTHSGTPLSIAFSPSGQLYISTGSQILRLSAGGRLEPVRIVIKTGPYAGRRLYDDFGPIAVGTHGDIDVAGVNGWAIWQVSPNGVAYELGYARRSGGNYAVLQTGPGGAIYSELGDAILRVEPHNLGQSSTINSRTAGEYFSLTYFALSPDGKLYADDIPGNTGDEAHQQLLSVTNHHISLLWQQGG
jgi:hypothetical protein